VKYRTIVVDPPWPYPEGFNGWGSRKPLPYSVMTVDEIGALPVRDLAEHEHGYIFLWTTSKHLPSAFDVVRRWGFSYRQTLTWDKGNVGSGLGGLFATTTEFILVAQNISEGTHAHAARSGTREVRRIDSACFRWPRGAHSAKPEAFYDMLESVSPGPYLELFARRNRLGWDTWGNEALNHIEIAWLVRQGSDTREPCLRCGELNGSESSFCARCGRKL
jgi:N6-adenosine-specific RNA methylase IME4